MVTDFVLEIVFFLSMAVVVYFIARRADRIAAEPDENPFSRLLSSLPVEKIDAAVNAGATKVLRKAKVLVLKIDNALTRSLQKMRAGERDQE
ncbi:MAG: hypothetical protein HYS43_01090 [Candidatus Liptonbacteria bacterium]|nr:hypothetical protein [Candidatus Liptonbacteria bacterium]